MYMMPAYTTRGQARFFYRVEPTELPEDQALRLTVYTATQSTSQPIASVAAIAAICSSKGSCRSAVRWWDAAELLEVSGVVVTARLPEALVIPVKASELGDAAV